MRRLVLSVIALLLVLWLLLSLGLLPPPVARFAEPLLATAGSLLIPGLFLTAYLAPGLFREWSADFDHFWRRLRTRRHEVEELQRKIAHLDRPYHMQQLGLIYAGQGRIAKARQLFEQALAKDPQSLDGCYQLGLCHFAERRYAEAADLLEAVHARKPEHDYGMAYLRLAESQQRLGHAARAREVYEVMLRFYPSHPEGSYHYALLLADQGSYERARALMSDVLFTVRHSPGFHRRRNRHWALRARYWLWRNRNR